MGKWAPKADYDTEEATAQYGMFLLGLELQVEEPYLLRKYLYDYILMLPYPNLHKAQADAMRAVGYLKMVAPEIFDPRATVSVMDVAI